MNQRIRAASMVVGIALLAASTFSAGAFDKAEYAARRSRLMEQIGDGAAVFLGAPTPASDNDFRQGHDFFYLTGIDVPDAFLIVDGLRKESILFFTMDEATADGEAIPLELIRKPASPPAAVLSIRCSSRRNWAGRTATRSSTRCRSR